MTVTYDIDVSELRWAPSRGESYCGQFLVFTETSHSCVAHGDLRKIDRWILQTENGPRDVWLEEMYELIE